MRGLFVTEIPPSFVGNGSGQRTSLLLDSFRNQADMAVLLLSDNPPANSCYDYLGPAHCSSRIPKQIPSIGRRFTEAMMAFQRDQKQRHAVEQAVAESQADFILIRYCRLAIRLAPLNQFTVPVIVDVDDLPSSKAKQWSQDPNSSPALRTMMSLRTRRLQKLEAKALSEASHSLVANYQESGDRSSYFPNICYGTPAAIKPWRPQCKIVCVGDFTYRPNRDGISWFIRKVWPIVQRQVPAATLSLAGKGSKDFTASEANVVGNGFVDDLAEYYASGALAIVPVLFGGGSNIKLIEALTHGLPTVTTSRCSSAFGDDFDELPLCHVADKPEAFADACIKGLRGYTDEPSGRAETVEYVQAQFGPEELRAVASQALGRIHSFAQAGQEKRTTIAAS